MGTWAPGGGWFRGGYIGWKTAGLPAPGWGYWLKNGDLVVWTLPKMQLGSIGKFGQAASFTLVLSGAGFRLRTPVIVMKNDQLLDGEWESIACRHNMKTL